MSIHFLKIHPVYMEEIMSGHKTFEVRKDDRDFKVGDTLRLTEYVKGDGGKSTDYYGITADFKVTYILRDRRYVKDGFCIMAIKFLEIYRG